MSQEHSDLSSQNVKKNFQKIRKGDSAEFERNISNKIDPEIYQILSMMLIKDPFKRPNATQILQKLILGKYKQIVEEAEFRATQTLVKERNVIPVCNENKRIRNHRCLFENQSSQLETTKVGLGTKIKRKSIFEMDMDNQEGFENQFIMRKKPQLLFDSKCPEMFPAYHESIVNPKKSKKRMKTPNLKIGGNILEMINVKSVDPKPKSPPYWKNLDSFHSDELFKK
jgi:serine/threonine protein kinase